MKNKSSSLKIKVFGYFAAFTGIMLVLLWLLQTVFLQQIYQSIKISSVKECAESAAGNIDENYISGLCDRYDVCIRIVDNCLMDCVNSHENQNCILHRLNYPILKQIYKVTLKSGGKRLFNITPVYNDPGVMTDFSSMSKVDTSDTTVTIIFAMLSETKLIMIESTISPVGATIDTLRIELYWVTGILIAIGFILALILSRKTARPIEKLNSQAKLLAKGNYNTDFTIEGYKEVEELGDTLNTAEEELSKVEKLRRELLANISHDLRTPLTMISGYAEVMRDIPGEQTPENIQVIIDESTRLTSLVNDILDISKLQVGAQKLELTEYCITDQVSQILGRYSKLIDQSGYKIEFIFDKKIEISADKNKIEQVIYNLINNAVNYTGEDKTVKIYQKDKGSCVRLEVCDSGSGIEADKLKYIWDRYYKLDKTHKRAQIGTGLGLSIVRGVIELHNGRYGVSSRIGKGSVFWFEIDKNKS